MENNSYDVFVESALQLAESIVLKSAQTAEAVNELVKLDYGMAAVNTLLPNTWKYYLNVSGQYHFTDVMIQVKSLDTLQTIDFTLENLQIHTATRKAYQYGTTQYKELVATNPGRERLILGVLYPADIDKAIASNNGTILSYPPSLVESTEYTFIQQLQTWIYDFLYRWDNKQYELSDNLYRVCLYANLYAFLAVEVLQIRLRMCRTNEVHTYHLRQYLASHGMLDVYLNYLTREQALFLYRNITYIERNSGKNAVFTWLVEHIMTSRELPIAAYEMRHNVSGMPGSLQPVISFQKIPLNTQTNLDTVDTYTPAAVYNKEARLARDNELYREEEFAEAIEKMVYSKDAALDTKLLESTVIDYTGSEHYTLADILVNHWLWFSSQDMYTPYINFNSPLNDDLIILRVKDAFALYLYATIKVLGFEIEDMPLVMAKRVIRLPKPTLSDLRSVATHRVTDDWVQMQLDHQPALTPMVSTDTFYAYCKELHQYSLEQYNLVCQEAKMETYAEKYSVMSRCWTNAWIRLGDDNVPNQTYTQWFAARNIPIEEFTNADLTDVAKTILEKSTGLDGISAVSLKDIQDAMIRLMTQLSSYSVQYIATINSGAILDVPNSTMRVDDIKTSVQQTDAYETAVRALSIDALPTHSVAFDPGGDADDWQVGVFPTSGLEHPVRVRPSLEDMSLQVSIDMPVGLNVFSDLPALPPGTPRGVINVLGIETFLALTPEQQRTVPDLWASYH